MKPTTTAIADKIPPNDIETEQKLLGQMLLDERIIPMILPILDVSYFYSAQSRIIYDAIATLFKGNLPANLHTVSRYLSEKGHGENIRYQLSTLVDGVITSAGFIENAHTITEKYQLRQIISIGNKMINEAYNAVLPHVDSDEIIDQYGTELIKLRQINSNNRIKPAFAIVPEIYQEIERANSGIDAENTAIPIGFAEIDSTTGGMPLNALTVVGGRGGMGKSSFALNLGLRRAEEGMTVAYFALEMSNSQMVRKAIANIANKDTAQIPVGKLFRTNAIQDDDWEPISSAGENLTNLDFWLQDNPSMTISQIRSDIQEILVRRQKLDLVIIDYVQLIQPERGAGRNQNRVLELDSILRSLRILAKDYNCVVLGLAQLSRAVEGRADKRPTQSDFRESGAFEQEAAMMLGLYREEYYDPETPEKGILEISALKSRFSENIRSKILFDPHYGVFRDNLPQN